MSELVAEECLESLILLRGAPVEAGVLFDDGGCGRRDPLLALHPYGYPEGSKCVHPQEHILREGCCGAVGDLYLSLRGGTLVTVFPAPADHRLIDVAAAELSPWTAAVSAEVAALAAVPRALVPAVPVANLCEVLWCGGSRSSASELKSARRM
ncbi:uncharacterized protein LOC143369794 [Andrena cerasifolii]|uniref:uncharacterized protein LOC143369794 n=1 Tax=Andrena cerasifolii TaxID=2819439 RepID=UPI004038195B